MFENNRKDITVAMMKNYPQLLRKFMADKAKVSSLVEIVMFMKLELYSLKRQEQVAKSILFHIGCSFLCYRPLLVKFTFCPLFQSFKAAVRLIKDAFFMNGEKEALRSCVKAITFCASESKGELQDFSRGKLKDLEDTLLDKLSSAIKEVKVCFTSFADYIYTLFTDAILHPFSVQDGNDEYSLLVNLKRLYELQLLKPVLGESMYDELAMTLHDFRNLDEEVVKEIRLEILLYLWFVPHILMKRLLVA